MICKFLGINSKHAYSYMTTFYYLAHLNLSILLLTHLVLNCSFHLHLSQKIPEQILISVTLEWLIKKTLFIMISLLICKYFDTNLFELIVSQVLVIPVDTNLPLL